MLLKFVFFVFPLANFVGTALVIRKPTPSQDPCLDYSPLNESLSVVRFSKRLFENKPRPAWFDRNFEPKVYWSEGVRFEWEWFKSLPVKGLKPTSTVNDVWDMLDSLKCAVVPYGEIVWKTLLRLRPQRMTAEVACPLTEVYNKCLLKFGANACGFYSINGSDHVEIGEASANSSMFHILAEPIRLFEWRSQTSRELWKREFSINDMAIFDNRAGKLFVVDMSGHSLTDTCNRRIAPSADTDKWWTDDVRKMFSFYHLRALGFSSDSELQHDVNKMLERLYTQQEGQLFYCEKLLSGIYRWGGDVDVSECDIVFPDNEQRRTINASKDVLETELGSLWKDRMHEDVDRLQAMYLTDRELHARRDQHDGRRDRVRATVSVPIISGSEPMVRELADVHRRPILAKFDAVNEVPPEWTVTFAPELDQLARDSTSNFHESYDDSSEVEDSDVEYALVESPPHNQIGHQEKSSAFVDRHEKQVLVTSSAGTSNNYVAFCLFLFSLSMSLV